MYHRFLIRMNEPEDWLRHWDEGTQVVNDFIFPQGPYEKDEMSDTIYHEGATVGYHQHQKGYETFQIVSIVSFHPQGRAGACPRRAAGSYEFAGTNANTQRFTAGGGKPPPRVGFNIPIIF